MTPRGSGRIAETSAFAVSCNTGVPAALSRRAMPLIAFADGNHDNVCPQIARTTAGG